jgi:hypothetical protein
MTTRYVYDEDSRVVEIVEERTTLGPPIIVEQTSISYTVNDQIKDIARLNVSSILPALGTVSRSFDAAGQRSDATHDEAGNVVIDLSSGSTSTYEWSLLGNLDGAYRAEGDYWINYDAIGSVQVITGGVDAQFSRNYASGAIVAVIRDGNGANQTYNVTTPGGQIVYQVDATTDERVDFHFGPDGSTSFLTDDSGTATDWYFYDPNGFQLEHVGTSAQPFTYLGQYGAIQLGTTPIHFVGGDVYDAWNGLYLNPLRQAPADGRYSNPYVKVGAQYGRTSSAFSTTAPIPRFADTSATTSLSRINACRTNLLFPFVTNQTGFDTGLAIANTSQDPFGPALQTGACRINYYGGRTSRYGATSSEVPKNAVPTTVLATQSGFQGYIVARCAFRDTHGFAFGTDLGAQRLAEGYLSLVLDGERRPQETQEVSAPEEQSSSDTVNKFRKKFPPGKPIRRTFGGFASSGTRFLARFNNVPAYLRGFVDVALPSPTGGSSSSDSGSAARAVRAPNILELFEPQSLRGRSQGTPAASPSAEHRVYFPGARIQF